MEKTINMQDMRYLNLFDNITKVRTKHCFKYNEFIIFAVPKPLVRKAVGEEGRNIRRISEILRKKIRVVPIPTNNDPKEFIQAIINPIQFKEIQITPEEVVITAGSQSKAAMIGRNRRRLLEMQKIIKDYFNKDLKIV